VAPRLRNHGHRSSTCHSLFGVKIIGRDINFLNRLRRRDIHGVVRQPYEYVRGTVDAGVVVVAISAVHVSAKRTIRGVGDGVLKYTWSRAGCEVYEGLEVAVGIQGQVLDSVGAQFRVNVGSLRLQQFRSRLDGNFLGYLAYL